MYINLNEAGLNIFFGSLEIQILEYLWDYGSGTARDIAIHLRTRNADRHFNTVATVLGRLTRAGITGYITRLRAKEYYPTMSKNEMEQSCIGRLERAIMSFSQK